MTFGPCLCGDPYCASCGNPALAELEDLLEMEYDKLYEYFQNREEIQIFFEAGYKAIKELREKRSFQR